MFHITIIPEFLVKKPSESIVSETRSQFRVLKLTEDLFENLRKVVSLRDHKKLRTSIEPTILNSEF